jgi:hypothetical protein
MRTKTTLAVDYYILPVGMERVYGVGRNGVRFNGELVNLDYQLKGLINDGSNQILKDVYKYLMALNNVETYSNNHVIHREDVIRILQSMGLKI